MAPRLKPPPNSCDTHIHIYDSDAPISAGASPGPAWATADAYRILRDRLGTRRAVIVQPNLYGTDNRVLVAAIADLSPDARGVATVGASITDRELERLTAAGVCGARFHMLPGGILKWEDLPSIAARVHAFGWHVQLQIDGRLLHEREHELKRWPGTLAVDHVGKFLEPVTVDHPGFRALARLLEGGRCWLKLSAPYEVSKAGPPLYADVGALAKAAAKIAPERMLWASNWPHVSVKEPLPDDAMLLDLLLDWIPDERERNAALVDNPAALYGFN
jgi:D-galactarolactone isomerase